MGLTRLLSKVAKVVGKRGAKRTGRRVVRGDRVTPPEDISQGVSNIADDAMTRRNFIRKTGEETVRVTQERALRDATRKGVKTATFAPVVSRESALAAVGTHEFTRAIEDDRQPLSVQAFEEASIYIGDPGD